MQAGFLLQPSYRIQRGVAIVQLFGRLASGEPFLVEDDRFRPYFFVQTRDQDFVRDRIDWPVVESDLRNLQGAPVSRVTVSAPSAVPPLRDALLAERIPVYEADIRFPYRFLIDQGIRASIGIEGASTILPGGLVHFRNPEICAHACAPDFRVLSLDIETTPNASRVLSFALAGAGIEEVHLVGPAPIVSPSAAALHVHETEARLLVALARRLAELDVDVIVGWNVVEFDLRVITERCRALNISPDYGRIPGPVSLRQDPGFTRQWRAFVPGRIVLDGIPLARDALRLPDYRLETVAQAVLGRGKLIAQDGPGRADEILELYRRDPAALAAYNLEDARLVLEILEREGLLSLTIERATLSGMQLDRVGASIASFDLIYLPELRRRGTVAPCVDRDRKLEAVRGGAVLDSKPGFFKNVAVFDFKSLYPSLIRTFQLDPLAHARAGGDAIKAPNGAKFARTGSILPEIVEVFTERREAAKARGDRHADQAIKIMMNAFFGVLGSASCRFFDPDVANAITSFGQQTLAWTRELFSDLGVDVIYGDTDSVFVQLRSEEPGEGAQQEAAALLERVEANIGQRIREIYRLDSKLTLELECVYQRFFMPRVRGGRGGSKKRYAGWRDGALEIVGLEAVRRDWPAVAKRLQSGLLERFFTDCDPLPFVRNIAERLTNGELDDELVYVKRLRKGALDRYTATTPPHVQAARKAGARAGDVIHYVITATGPEPAWPGEGPRPDIDRRHYLERVLRPVADAILREAGHSFDEALGEPQQLPLL